MLECVSAERWRVNCQDTAGGEKIMFYLPLRAAEGNYICWKQRQRNFVNLCSNSDPGTRSFITFKLPFGCKWRTNDRGLPFTSGKNLKFPSFPQLILCHYLPHMNAGLRKTQQKWTGWYWVARLCATVIRGQGLWLPEWIVLMRR